MIDRAARRQAAETIRRFVNGQITNKEFLRRYPNSKEDPAIWALDDTVWCLYDDILIHKLSGKYALTKEFKSEVSRWLLFLYSDAEYQWPKIGKPGFRQAQSWVCRALPFARRRFKRFRDAGDYSVWPFLRWEDFEEARRKPVLLGRSHRTNV
jgi:hypothetical protein